MNLYIIHGFIQLITFGILFPLGALIAIFRNWVGSNWFIIHTVCQITASLLLFIAVILIKIAKSKSKKNKDADDDEEEPLHVKMGHIIISLVLFQLLWVIFMRYIIYRPFWYFIHMLTAISIITLGWINIYLGYKHHLEATTH